MKSEKLYMVLDDTNNIDKKSLPILDEKEQKLHDELIEKHKKKYLSQKSHFKKLL